MSKQAFEKIKGGLDEALIIAPYVAEIERLRAENEKLRAALMPLAEYEFDDFDDDEDETASPFILVKHLRAAAAALKENDE